LFAKIGLGLIFALVGLTIDQRTLGGVSGRLGAIGWLATLGVGVLVASTLPLGGGLRPVALVVALSSTALSTLVVILQESGEWGSPLGRLLLSAGTWGQLGPVLAVALLLGSADLITTVFSVVLVVMVAWLLAMVPAQMRQANGWPWLVSQVGTASATPLQLLYLLIVGLIALSVYLGVDILMGTVLAGLVMRRYIENPQTSAVLKQLETSAYGLFVPLFFVVAGSRLDLASVAANPWGPVVCLAGILVIRGLPQWLLYRRTLPDPIERLRFSLLVSQSLNLPIVVAYLEVQAGLMSPEVGAALLGGSLLSVLVLPAVALAIKR
jgi:Kef-type K+ transport system membrane component KefB